MADALRIDPNKVAVSPGVSRVSVLGGVRLGRIGLSVVIAKDTGPLLDRLVVVVGQERVVGGAVVDLHLGATAVVAGIHIMAKSSVL